MDTLGENCCWSLLGLRGLSFLLTVPLFLHEVVFNVIIFVTDPIRETTKQDC